MRHRLFSSLALPSLALIAAGLLCAPASAKDAKETPAKKKGPIAIMTTNMGTIEIELNREKAPVSVKNFISYAKSGRYNGTIFHRVIKDFMIQGGGFDTNLQKRPTDAPIPNEAANGLSNLRGTIAMARTGQPHSATNQFFINTVDNKRLDHTGKNMRGWGYAVFGKVTKGMDVVDKIRAVPTGSCGHFRTDCPKNQVVILKVEVKE